MNTVPIALSTHIRSVESARDQWLRWFREQCRGAEPHARDHSPYVFAWKRKAWANGLKRRVQQLDKWTREGAPIFFAVHHLTLTDTEGELQHDLGPVGMKLISTSFTEVLVDAMQGIAGGLTSIANYQFHTFGSSAAAEVNTQNALTAEFAATVWTASVRPGSTQQEGGAANIYRATQLVPLSVAGGQGPITIAEVGAFLTNVFLATGMFDREVLGATIGRNDGEGVQNEMDYTALPEP